MARNSVTLLGQPYTNEDGVATEAITPGMLVEGVTAISKRATANTATPRTFCTRT